VSQDTTYSTSGAVFNKDTLFYQWKIRNYTNDSNMRLLDPMFNGKIWVSLLNLRAHVSFDNLLSWKNGKTPEMNYGELQNSCLLPNNKIFATVLDKKNNTEYYSRLFYSYDITKEWTELELEIFKDKFLGSIVFKDSLNGVIAVTDELTFRNLYRTDDGGNEWVKLDNISNILETDTNIIVRMDYFNESEILMCIIYNSPTNNYYFVFSKDFGESWTEFRDFPKKSQSVLSHYPRWGFYSRHDSLWFAGSTATGAGDIETYESIFFSKDLGKSWVPQYLSITSNSDVFTSIEFFDNSLVGLACETGPRVFITFDGGEHWSLIRHEVTKNGIREYNDLLDKNYDKFKLKKANNKMIFFGYHKIFMFDNLNLPATGVEDETKSDFSAFYNTGAEAIEIKSNSDEIINSITLYDITGKLLYSENIQSSGQIYISKYKLNNTKVVFALIQTNGQTFIKQIICG